MNTSELRVRLLDGGPVYGNWLFNWQDKGHPETETRREQKEKLWNIMLYDDPDKTAIVQIERVIFTSACQLICINGSGYLHFRGILERVTSDTLIGKPS